MVFPSRIRQLQPVGPLLQSPSQTLIGRQRLVRIRPEPAHTLGSLLLAGLPVHLPVTIPGLRLSLGHKIPPAVLTAGDPPPVLLKVE